ncbi:MAG: heparinase II/III family protein [Clostridia bacterium]|nr:heparinase II/III family protein [Clostridia bacterium]
MQRLFEKHGLTSGLPIRSPEQVKEAFAILFPASALHWEHKIPEAEALLDKPVPYLSASMYRDYLKTGNRSRFEAAHNARRGEMLNLALAEFTEGKGRFTDRLIDAVWAILDEANWILPAHNFRFYDWGRDIHPLPERFGYGEGDEVRYIDLVSASTAASLSMVLYLLRDTFAGVSDAIERRIVTQLDVRIFRPFLDHHMYWMGEEGKRLNNWTPWIVSNVLTCALFWLKEEDRRRALVERSIRILDNYTETYAASGCCDEGPSYWVHAPASYFDCLELLHLLTAGKTDIFSDPFIRRMCEYIADVYLGDGKFVNFADASCVQNIDHHLLARMGDKLGSAKLTRMAGEAANRDIRPLISGSSIYRGITNRTTVLPEGISDTAGHSVFYPDQALLMVRSPATGMVLAGKGGTNGDSHNHNDVGSFILFCQNRPVFIDAGVETYTKTTFSKDRYTLWTMRSSYHNLPDIAGKEQQAGGTFHANTLSHTDETVVFSLKDAYPTDTGIHDYTRSMGLTEDGAVFTDTLSLDRPAEVVWHLMLAEKPEIGQNRFVLREAGCEVHITVSAELEIQVETIPLTDPKLHGEWKQDDLYRLCLRVPKWTDGTFTLEVKSV